ncbi:MAG: hypothetical protein U5L11_10660 [Arhodomonas sp.]|nr:hypothetical protein [Arhodomonas sp.]
MGIIGDTVDTIREQRDDAGRPLPNTLWWLIAQQTLAPADREGIRARLEQSAATRLRGFFRTLLGGQPTLLVIDEVAQYLARMEAAFPGQGAEQAAAFLMSLATYAEDKPNIAVVLSLASATNAFGDVQQAGPRSPGRPRPGRRHRRDDGGGGAKGIQRRGRALRRRHHAGPGGGPLPDHGQTPVPIGGLRRGRGGGG